MFDFLAAKNKWPGILTELGVNEKYLNGKHGPCPCCGGKNRWRFDNKDGRGTWYCSQCEPRAGDGIALVMKIRNCDFLEATKLVEKVIPNAKTIAAKPIIDPRPRLRKVWSESTEIVRGDEVWTYLKNRNVLPDYIPTDIRIGEDDYYEDGKKVGRFKAMVAMIRDANGKPKSLHLTYLKDGKKAPVESPKKVLSPIGNGSAIRLHAPSDVLCIAEGIETSIAVHKKTGKPVWSLISSGNFKAFSCPEVVKRIEIWSDNDLNYVGQFSAFGLANRLAIAGVDVDVFVPSNRGSDWADQ